MLVLFLMMIFYIKENKSSKYTLLFGIMCIGSSAYGFLAGTWPFGIIEVVCAMDQHNVIPPDQDALNHFYITI